MELFHLHIFQSRMNGLVDVVYITGALLLAPKLRAVGFIAPVIAGQMFAALIIGRWGVIGFLKISLSLPQLAGLGLIFLVLIVMQLQALGVKPPAGG